MIIRRSTIRSRSIEHSLAFCTLHFCATIIMSSVCATKQKAVSNHLRLVQFSGTKHNLVQFLLPATTRSPLELLYNFNMIITQQHGESCDLCMIIMVNTLFSFITAKFCYVDVML